MLHANDLLDYQEYLKMSPKQKTLFIKKKYDTMGGKVFDYMKECRKRLVECERILEELKL